MRLIHINQRKWPDTPHWHFDAAWLGDDAHGMWVFVSADTVIQRGDEPQRLSGVDFVGLIPRDEPWIVEFYRDHPEHQTYVNIGTVPVWDGALATQVDLDLDVILTPDGSVRVIDIDEFTEHQISLAYPSDLIDHAQNAADEAARRIGERVAPFDQRPDHWWNQASVYSS